MLMGSHRDQTWISAWVSVLWRKKETAWRESQARFFFRPAHRFTEVSAFL